MPSNQMNKDEIKCYILKLIKELDHESEQYIKNPKDYGYKYLYKILDKVEEYRY